MYRVIQKASSLIFLYFILLCSTQPANAETLMFYEGDRPLSHPAGTKPQGLYFDIVTTLFDDMGVKYRVSSYPFKRALRQAYEGEGIVVGILKTDERSRFLDYSESLYDSKVVLFTHKNRKFPLASVADLKGKKIATKLGWSYGTAFDQARARGEFFTMDGEAERHLKLLSKGRADGFIDNYLSGVYTIKQLNLADTIKPLPYVIDKGPHYLGVKKGTRSNLIKTFNQHLKTFMSDGRYEKILAKYH